MTILVVFIIVGGLLPEFLYFCLLVYVLALVPRHPPIAPPSLHHATIIPECRYRASRNFPLLPISSATKRTFLSFNSCNTGKAGCLKNAEPLKTVKKQEPPKGGSWNNFSCSIPFILFLLFLIILSHGILIFTNHRHIIFSCSEKLTNKILLLSLEIPSNLNCTFSFDKTNHLGCLMNR